MTSFGGIAAADLVGAETVFEPPGRGEGHWVGAPRIHRHDGTTYLAVRWRSPERRGYALAFYERTASGEFAERRRITADDLGAVSVERPALVTDRRSGDLKLYVPVEHGENDWTIRALDGARAPRAFDPATARDVLVPEPGMTDAETVKDPCVVVHDERYYMFYAGHDGVSEQAHLATSADGESWTRVDHNPVLGRRGWHDHHTRISCLVPSPDGSAWLCYYDGSGTDDYGATWNLRTGVAVARDLARPTDATPDGPVLSSPAFDRLTEGGFETCRYADVLDRCDGRELFVEVARADGSFELRRCPLETP